MQFIMLSLLFVTIACIPFCSCKRPFAGPYRMIFKGLALCDDVGEGAFTYGTRYSKINRTHVAYSSNFTIKYGFRDSMQISMDLSVFGNGGYHDNFMNIRMNRACTDFLKLMPGLIETMYASTGGTNFTGCPINPGTYELKNWIFNLRFATSVFPYNKYKMKVTVYEHGKLLTCAVFDLDVIPREETRRPTRKH